MSQAGCYFANDEAFPMLFHDFEAEFHCFDFPVV